MEPTGQVRLFQFHSIIHVTFLLLLDISIEMSNFIIHIFPLSRENDDFQNHFDRIALNTPIRLFYLNPFRVLPLIVISKKIKSR